MPAKKCSTRKSAPKRKPAAKRKSSTTRRASATTRRPSSARSRCASAPCARRSVSACATGCRSPYMVNGSGKCGAVPCVDEATGNPLLGYVRNSRGECAPKNCGAGYVFNYATGKCVSQNSAMGQQLMAVKKYNDAELAKAQAQKVLDNLKPTYTTGSVEEMTYGQMLGGTQQIAKAQAAYQKSLREMQTERQQAYQKQLNTAYDIELQRSKLLSGGRGNTTCSTTTNPWGSFF